MTTFNKKAEQYNLQYLITEQVQTYSVTSSRVCHAVQKESERKCFRDHEKDKKQSRKNRSKKHRKPTTNYNEAKFSDDQQEQLTATSQIPRKESPKTQTHKPQAKKFMSFNDLAYFPKGSILSLKTCNIDIPTKSYGKADFSVEILSQQQHKTLISQFFDPGFTVLSIKKDKKQAQIIQYLSQPTKKGYKYAVCWFEAVSPQDNTILREIATEGNQRQRIYGWHNDHVKLHIMSMRQLAMIQKFTAPSKFASQAAATTLRDERVVMIMQYPQRNYEIKDLYHPFASISRKKEEFAPQTVETPNVKEPETQIAQQEAAPAQKLWFQQIKIVYEGWDDVTDETNVLPSQNPTDCSPAPEIYKDYDLPAEVERIRQHFGIKTFEPILSDQEEDDQNEKVDLATELLNLLEEQERKSTCNPVPMEIVQPTLENYQRYSQYDYYQGQYYQTGTETQWNSNYQVNSEYQMQGYQSYYQNNDYNHSYLQYSNQTHETTHSHINQSCWIPQSDAQYYINPTPGQSYNANYQY